MGEVLAFADDEAKGLWEQLSLGCTEISGHPLLRREIAGLYGDVGVFTFAGAAEGVYCALRTLIEPGDHVVGVEPCYSPLVTLPRAFGADLTVIALDAKRGWQLSLEEVERAFRPKTKLLILNFPHNPTGTVMERGVFEGVVELARKRGAFILCNEVYRYLEIDEGSRLPSIADAYEKGIAVNVLTKAFGLGGLRVGWIATQDREFLKEVGEYKLYTSVFNSAPSEILALIALRARGAILKRNREIVLGNLAQFEAFMGRHGDVLSWVPPQGGPMALVELRLPVAVETFARELREEREVLILPGSLFDLPGNFFRVGFGKKKMAQALERFELFLGSLEQRVGGAMK